VLVELVSIEDASDVSIAVSWAISSIFPRCMGMAVSSIYKQLIICINTVNRARQLCSGNHKVHEEGVGQEIHGDELH
jgi:hypothetical protein